MRSDKKTEPIWNIFKMHAVSAGLAGSLVGIFIPIYLLRIGNSLSEVMIFLIVHHIALFASAFIVVFLSNKIGLIYTLRIRFAFLFLYLFPYQYCGSRFSFRACGRKNLFQIFIGKVRGSLAAQ